VPSAPTTALSCGAEDVDAHRREPRERAVNRREAVSFNARLDGGRALVIGAASTRGACRRAAYWKRPFKTSCMSSMAASTSAWCGVVVQGPFLDERDGFFDPERRARVVDGQKFELLDAGAVTCWITSSSDFDTRARGCPFLFCDDVTNGRGRRASGGQRLLRASAEDKSASAWAGSRSTSSAGKRKTR
jgi:hypothetical protein